MINNHDLTVQQIRSEFRGQKKTKILLKISFEGVTLYLKSKQLVIGEMIN